MVSWQSKAIRFFAHLYLSIRSKTSIDTIQLRNNIERLARLAPPVKGVSTQKTILGNIPSMEIHPEDADEDKVILYLHGGAYNLCSYNTHKRMVSRIAISAKTNAILINYRLAPEHPYPAALEDAMAAYNDLINKNYKHIIIAGDSAGGGLAMALLFKIRAENLRTPTCAVVLSPWMDLSFSMWEPSAHAIIYLEQLKMYARNYYMEHDPADPYISPLFGNFDNLPPVLLQVTSAEALYHEIMSTAEKMKNEKVNVTLQTWDEVIHVWQAYGFAPEAKDAVKKIGEFIRTHAV